MFSSGHSNPGSTLPLWRELMLCGKGWDSLHFCVNRVLGFLENSNALVMVNWGHCAGSKQPCLMEGRRGEKKNFKQRKSWEQGYRWVPEQVSQGSELDVSWNSGGIVQRPFHADTGERLEGTGSCTTVPRNDLSPPELSGCCPQEWAVISNANIQGIK